MSRLAVICMVLLAGCAQVREQGMTRLEAVADEGHELNLEGLRVAEHFICRKADVSAIREAFRGRVQVWNDLCARGDGWQLEEDNGHE